MNNFRHQHFEAILDSYSRERKLLRIVWTTRQGYAYEYQGYVHVETTCGLRGYRVDTAIELGLLYFSPQQLIGIQGASHPKPMLVIDEAGMPLPQDSYTNKDWQIATDNYKD